MLLLIVGVMALALLFAPEDLGVFATVAMVGAMLLFASVAFYLFAGAPRLTRAIQRRFPSQSDHRHTHIFSHRTKAWIGISVGVIGSLGLYVAMGANWNGLKTPTDFQETLLMFCLFSPAISIWGAMHLARHQRNPVAIPLVIGVLGIGIWVVLFAVAGTQLGAVIGHLLSSIGPALILLLKGGNRHRHHR
jgi:predicted PurR-regulated permease PerM